MRDTWRNGCDRSSPRPIGRMRSSSSTMRRAMRASRSRRRLAAESPVPFRIILERDEQRQHLPPVAQGDRPGIRRPRLDRGVGRHLPARAPRAPGARSSSTRTVALAYCQSTMIGPDGRQSRRGLRGTHEGSLGHALAISLQHPGARGGRAGAEPAEYDPERERRGLPEAGRHRMPGRTGADAARRRLAVLRDPDPRRPDRLCRRSRSTRTGITTGPYVTHSSGPRNSSRSSLQVKARIFESLPDLRECDLAEHQLHGCGVHPSQDGHGPGLARVDGSTEAGALAGSNPHRLAKPTPARARPTRPDRRLRR